ncbi:cold shock domain-containing protein [Streptomyces sp. NBC_01136]|uniref:cold-shock protein n=1 Tax=unclassified Streptomyces TaxID=2593676 RepID=UPI0032488138|nr:cold shock domain-containing protein [Streptomyces sp. NBC_01136]
MSERVSGVVRWFNQVRGDGYIDGDDGREARVQREAIEGGTFLAEGLRVTYVLVGDDDDDLHAEHIRIVE